MNYATSRENYWIYPCDQRPPGSTDVYLLTLGGTPTIGRWHDGGDFIAWQWMFLRDKTKENGL